MIRGGFLSTAERHELRALASGGLSEARAARRANAIILLDKSWSCQEVAEALLIDDDTARSWRRLYDEHGLTGLVVFDVGGSHSRLSAEQEAALFAWVSAHLPRNTRAIGAWIADSFGL
jgi:transposase